MGLSPSAPGAALAYTLTPTLNATTLLSSSTPLVYGSGAGLGNRIDGVTPIGSGAPPQNTATKFYFTGRSDNFDPSQNSGNSNNARFDPESIRVSNDGKSVFISGDEYGPYVYQFDRTTGQRIKSFPLPANLYVSNLSPQGSVEISGNTTGRVANKGMEGLAITPDGKTLVGIMQAELEQDPKNLLRIVTIDIASGATHEYGYLLTTGSGVSDIVAINDHQFLIDERDGKGLGDGSAAAIKQLFEIDLNGAMDITNLAGNAAKNAAVGKTLVLDIRAVLNANGFSDTQIPAKIEGLAFGQDVLLNGVVEHTLFVSNDNDFVANVAGPNQFFVFAFTDSDLPGFVQQQPVPEPTSLAVLSAGLLGFGLLRRRPRERQPGAAVC
jgi:Esterase-like activity of phytase/PEP-CTERM motif